MTKEITSFSPFYDRIQLYVAQNAKDKKQIANVFLYLFITFAN